LRSSIDWILQNYGEDTWQKILSLLPAELQGKARNVVTPLMYPAALGDKIYRVFADECCGKEQKAREEAFRKMGRYIAEENLSTVYRLLLRFMTPGQFLGRLPKVWTTYFDGIDVTVQQDAEAQNGTCRVRGLDIAYMSLVASGWIELGYEKVGATSSTVLERSWKSGQIASDDMVFEISWTT
jgi:hypothetical protein